MVRPAFSDPRVRAVFRTYTPELRVRLLELRRLIFDTASKTTGVGKLQETLKWEQPSYLTAASGSGTTIRIDEAKNKPGSYALYVHCQTVLSQGFANCIRRRSSIAAIEPSSSKPAGKFPELPCGTVLHLPSPIT